MTSETTVAAPPEETLEAVVRAARVFSAVTAESIAQAGSGVTLPQLRVLVLASTAGVLNNNAVADALDVHISNASRICDRLVQAGLLARRDSPADRRNVELTLTSAGSRLLSGVADHRRRIFSRTLQTMSPEQHQSLAHTLTAFVEVAEKQLGGRADHTP